MELENKIDEIEIDLSELFHAIFSKFAVIVIVAVLFGGIAFGYTKIAVKPMYTSSTKVYILNKPETNALSTNDLAFASYLARDYKVLLVSNPVLKEVISELNLNMTTKTLASRISVELIDAFIKALKESKADKYFWEPRMNDYVLDKTIDFDGNNIFAYKHSSFRYNQVPNPQEILFNNEQSNNNLYVMNINEAVNNCLSNMKASEDFNDLATVNSIKNLLSCVIDNPSNILNNANEEKLSIALSSILTCQFPSDYPKYKGIDVRNLVFASSFYL